jgi:hypothetical protein
VLVIVIRVRVTELNSQQRKRSLSDSVHPADDDELDSQPMKFLEKDLASDFSLEQGNYPC